MHDGANFYRQKCGQACLDSNISMDVKVMLKVKTMGKCGFCVTMRTIYYIVVVVFVLISESCFALTISNHSQYTSTHGRVKKLLIVDSYAVSDGYWVRQLTDYKTKFSDCSNENNIGYCK